MIDAYADPEAREVKVLASESSGPVPSDLAGAVLTWAENDTVLVNGGRRGRGTLLFLDRRGD